MNEWIWNNGAACYNSLSPGYALTQYNLFELGKLYTIQFTIEGLTQGKIKLTSLSGHPEFSADGIYNYVGIAISHHLTFIGEEVLGGVLIGCLKSVSMRAIPFYRIEDLDNNIIFELTDQAGVSSSGPNVQYKINWTEIPEGCYKIKITDLEIDYESDCLELKLMHDCTLLLEWTNNENAYSFEYVNLLFTPKLRVNSKLWQPKYSKEKFLYKDSSGSRSILKSETSKEELLTVGEVPEYIHDALSIGLENDFFYVEGIKYTNEETEYSPKWRKSSQLAPVEIVIIKDQNLKNSNC